jgi:hypothetical protein
MLPERLQVSILRHLTLAGFALPIGSRLLTTAVGLGPRALVSLGLLMKDTSTYFHWLSFMPHLMTLAIFFLAAVPNREIERQLMHMSLIKPVTLPDLNLGSVVLVLTWKHLLIGSQLLASRSPKLNSSIGPCFPSHVSCSL